MIKTERKKGKQINNKQEGDEAKQESQTTEVKR